MSEDDNKIINIILKCPHCDSFMEIAQLNCKIFRHGILRANGKQIDPHSPKDLCDYYIKKDKIYGCGKPFRIEKNGQEYVSIICNYI
jgi:hypothetical protein